MASQADRIREHVVARLTALATTCGSLLAIRSGDVVQSMGLAGRTPAVCSVLKGSKFQQMAGLELVEQRGPATSTTTKYLYKQIHPVSSAPIDGQRQRPTAVPRQVHERTAPSVEAPASESAALPTSALCLVSCVAQKLSHAAPAKDLYRSDWFRKARRFVEARGWPWLILSAKHGLLEQEQVIAPYNKTLKKMRVAERRDWAEGCLDALGPHLVGVKSVVFLAGEDYRKCLALALCDRGIEVYVPMAGLRQGEQLAWLRDHTP